MPINQKHPLISPATLIFTTMLRHNSSHTYAAVSSSSCCFFFVVFKWCQSQNCFITWRFWRWIYRGVFAIFFCRNETSVCVCAFGFFLLVLKLSKLISFLLTFLWETGTRSNVMFCGSTAWCLVGVVSKNHIILYLVDPEICR